MDELLIEESNEMWVVIKSRPGNMHCNLRAKKGERVEEIEILDSRRNAAVIEVGDRLMGMHL